MKLYTKARCRNCGKLFICDKVTEISYTKDSVLKDQSDFNITCPPVLHDCSRDDDTDDENIIGIADIIGLIFKES